MLALLSLAVLAATPPLTVRAGHPRVFWTADDLPRLKAMGYAPPRADLTASSFTTGSGGGIHGEPNTVTWPLPPAQPGKLAEPPGFDAKTYGHYPYWTGMSGRVQGFLQEFALAYAASGEPAWGDRAQEFCLALAGWSTWTDPDYHPDLTPCLDTGHFLIGTAAAYDACYDRFTPEQRRTFAAAAQRLGLEPTFRWVSGERQQASEFNLEILLNAALGLSTLALHDELPPADAARYLSQARSYFLRFLDRKLTSPNTEGLAYATSLDTGSIFADALRRATGDDAYFRHPYLNEQLPRWLAWFAGPAHSGGLNFGDCGGYPQPFPTTLRLLSNGGHAAAGWLLGLYAIGESGPGWAGLYDRASRTATAPGWPASGLVEPLGWAALRTGWGDEANLLAFKCSRSQEGHDHNDQGNLVLNVAGTWLLTDLGYGSFRNATEGQYSRGTPGHNAILVDGEGQTRRAGTITAFSTGERLDRVVGDASACYDPKLLKTWRREVVAVKPDYYVVVDTLESDGTPRAFQWLLHCDGPEPFELDGHPAAIGATVPVRRIRVHKPRAEAILELLAPVGATARYAAWPGTEAHYPPYLTIEGPKAVRRTFVMVIEPHALAGDLLANGGFEGGLDGWSVGGEPGNQVKAELDREVRHGGSASLRLTGTDPKRDRSLAGQWFLPAKAGATYRLTAWVRARDLVGHGPVIDLTCYDAARKHTPPVAVKYGAPGTYDWQPLVLEATAPPGAALLTVRAGLDWAQGSLWLDDVKLEQLDAEPAPPPVHRAFALVGDPEGGAFGVRVTGGGREDLLLFRGGDAPATVAGHEAAAPVTLYRTEQGRTTQATAG